MLNIVVYFLDKAQSGKCLRHPQRFGGFLYIEVNSIIIPTNYVDGLLQINIRTPQAKRNFYEVI